MNKTIFLVVSLLLAVTACSKEKKEKLKSSTEKKIVQVSSEVNDWMVLFDGTSTKHWRGYLSESLYPEWTIEGDALKFTPSDRAGKNIITKEKFTNFILSLEWKISEKGNSGIFWGIFEDKKFPEAYQTGPEIQVFDNQGDSQSNINSKHTAGSLFDMIACPVELVKPVGEWNECILKVDHKNNIGSVTMNGTEAFTFPVHGEKWDEMVQNSKFKGWEGFGKYQKGHIGLQDHSDIVWFRNIKIKEL